MPRDDSLRITADPDVRRARALAKLLDSAVGVPGTPIRVGLDAVLGLLPGAGDAIAAALSGYIVLAAAKKGAPATVIARMLLNIGIDTLVGSIPILGDLFDVGFKSNVRNVALLERYAEAPAALSSSSRRIGIAVIIVLAIALVTLTTLGFLAARALWHLLSN